MKSTSAQAVAVAEGGDLSESRVLALAAALERRANHPIAVAIAAHAEAEGEHAIRMARSSGLQTGGPCSTGYLGSQRGWIAEVTAVCVGRIQQACRASRDSHVSTVRLAHLICARQSSETSSSGAAALTAKDGSVEQEPGSVS